MSNASTKGMGTSVGTLFAFDAPLETLSSSSDTSAGVVDERIRKKIEEEKKNDDHWAPGGQEGDGTELVLEGDGIGHGEVDGKPVSHAGAAPGIRTPAGPSGPEGGIGQGSVRAHDCLEPCTAATDVDFAHVCSRLLDPETAPVEPVESSAIEELERTVSEGLSRLDFSEDSSSTSYLVTEMHGNHMQRDLLDEKVAAVPERIRTPYRHFLIHLLQCARIYWTDKWHRMHSENVLIEQLPGGWVLEDVPGATSRLWDFEGSAAESRNDGEYHKPDEEEPGRTREYRIDPTFAIRFWQLASEADANYKLHERDGTPNKREQGSVALKTKFRDDTGHRWGEEQDLPGGHYSLLDGAVRVLSDATHKIDISEITEMKEIYRKEWESAVSQLGQARDRYDHLNYIGDDGSASTTEEENEIREARRDLSEAETRKEKAEGRYHALLSGLEIISRQADRIEDGIAYVQNAYEVQPVSGRLSFRRGGPQGLPAVLKSFAYSMEGVYNYDIKSSQTTGLRQLAEDLRQVGCDVDTGPLDDYLQEGGKDWVTENYNLPRSLVKTVEHAIKFGAKIPASMKQAYGQKKSTVWGMPEIAEHIEGYFPSREEQERALEDLQEIFGPQAEMIEDLAEGLLTGYWDTHSYAGGRGKGRVMKNHCGITFCKYDHEGGHEARSKAMAWYLQGLEAAYVHALTVLSEDYDYEVMANEHDGLITIGTIPDEAQRRARELSGSRNAELTDKRFEGEEEVREVASALGWEVPSPPLEEKSSEATDSKATASEATASEATATGPGESEPPTRPGTTSGSKETTSREASSQKAGSETGSGGVPDAAGGPGASISENGDQTASSATEQPDSEQCSNWREEESEETLDYLLPDREISHREVSDKELEEILGAQTRPPMSGLTTE